jgi:hypothetical protein
MRQRGSDVEQQLFRGILMRLRNGQPTEEDWKTLMNRRKAIATNADTFNNALRLYTTCEAAYQYNADQLKKNKNVVAVIKLFMLEKALQKLKPTMLVDYNQLCV